MMPSKEKLIKFLYSQSNHMMYEVPVEELQAWEDFHRALWRELKKLGVL